MKKIMMFDDFLINRTDGTRRRFHQPEWRYDQAFTDPISPLGVQGITIVPAPQGGYYMTYYLMPMPDAPFTDENIRVGLAYSKDGIRFEPYDLTNPINPASPHILGHVSETFGSDIYFDAAEVNPNHRYKAVCEPYGNSPDGSLIEEAPILLVSGDALHWSVLNHQKIVPSYVDCFISFLRNPITGRFQATTRRRWGERRICLVESSDLSVWTLPRAILHPLPTDEPTTHYYSMPHFYYQAGDLFIGFLWKHVMPFNRIMDGPMSTEYAYSYDGLLWNRTWADVANTNGRGETGGGGSFAFSLLEQGDDLIAHANAFLYEHSGVPEGGEALVGTPGRVIVTGKLKKDRFVGIDSGKGRAEMITQHLKLHSPELLLNVISPFATVQVQINQEDKPVEGYTYDDCLPIKGDHLAFPLKWKGGSLDRFCGTNHWIRVQIRFDQAEIFSLTGDFDFNINPKAPEYERL